MKGGCASKLWAFAESWYSYPQMDEWPSQHPAMRSKGPLWSLPTGSGRVLKSILLSGSEDFDLTISGCTEKVPLLVLHLRCWRMLKRPLSKLPDEATVTIWQTFHLEKKCAEGNLVVQKSRSLCIACRVRTLSVRMCLYLWDYTNSCVLAKQKFNQQNWLINCTFLWHAV